MKGGEALLNDRREPQGAAGQKPKATLLNNGVRTLPEVRNFFSN